MVASVLFLSLFSLSGAVSGDEHWDVQFGAPGVTNNIFAVAVNNGLVYAAGAVPTGAHTNTPLSCWKNLKYSSTTFANGIFPEFGINIGFFNTFVIARFFDVFNNLFDDIFVIVLKSQMISDWKTSAKINAV